MNIGLAGVSGALGTELLALLREERFPVGLVKLFGAGGSAGDVHELGGEHHVVRRLEAAALQDLDVVVLASPAEASRRLAGIAIAAGVFVVDASSAFRADPEVPLVAPPINRAALEQATGCVATPGAFSLALAHVLANLPPGSQPVAMEATGLAAAATLGRQGMTALSSQVLAVLGGRPPAEGPYPRAQAFDLIPWLGESGPGDSNPVSAEERRVLAELDRLLPGRLERAGCTLALAPVFCGHSLSLRLEFAEPPSLDEIVASFRSAPALELRLGQGPEEVPTALDSVERPEILVGRLRLEPDERVLRLWLAFDNLRLSARNLVLTLEALRDEGSV